MPPAAPAPAAATAATADDDNGNPPLSPPRYIVIGAGPAGCALAAALAEGQEGGVVLLEMGPDLVGVVLLGWVK
jgi:NADPH-dependent 2,4-dienoyl-CoA reductase/sulfur reductase-like enzyme